MQIEIVDKRKNTEPKEAQVGDLTEDDCQECGELISKCKCGRFLSKDKFILDACCGSRMFWFDKKQPNTLFCDIRSYNKGFVDNRPNRELHPDMIMDFRDLHFPEKHFKLVVFDPPHLIGKPNGCRMTKTYGSLSAETWQDDIKRGFDECWRVLDDYGILIFKWNDASKKRKEVLNIIGKEPLFGHPNGSKIPTHWFCFMKIPKSSQEQVSGKS